MKPIVTTLIMALIACVTSAVAWHYYPRIEVQAEVEREQLLTEDEAFQSRDVREIRIEQFDRSRNSPSEFVFKYESGSWVIPGRGNYPANNTARVAETVNAMRDKEVLEMVSDNKDDHEEYGVLEMSEVGSTGRGAGTVLTFEGRNRTRLGKMIVGTSPEGKENQRYVRLAGQPQIYIIEMNDAALTTDFSDWVDGSLIKLLGDVSQLPGLIKSIDVNLYYMDQGGESTRKTNYRARITQTDEGRWLYDLWQPDENQQLPEEPTVASQNVNSKTLSDFIKQVMRFDIRDVAKKQESAALNLANPKPDQPASHFDSLKNRGFYHVGFEQGQHQFDSAAGEIIIQLRIGMEIRLNIGAMAAVDVAGGGKINRFLMVSANKNESLFPLPENPNRSGADTDEGDEVAEGDDAAENSGAGEIAQDAAAQDEAERIYQAAIQQRNEVLAVADRETRSMNQVHADWIYVVPEEVIANLFPAAEAWKVPSN